MGLELREPHTGSQTALRRRLSVLVLVFSWDLLTEEEKVQNNGSLIL